MEVIIVNDGSKDGTAAIAEDYQSRYPGIVVYGEDMCCLMCPDLQMNKNAKKRRARQTPATLRFSLRFNVAFMVNFINPCFNFGNILKLY